MIVSYISLSEALEAFLRKTKVKDEGKMQKVLIVDDDITIVRFLKDLISKTLHLPC